MTIYRAMCKALAVLLVVALTGVFQPASADTTIMTTRSIVTQVPLTSGILMDNGNGTLAFSGTVLALEPEEAIVFAGGSRLRIPLRLAHFSVNGLDMDGTRMYPGMPVTVSFDNIRGTVTSLRGNAVCLDTPQGRLDLPSAALNSSALAYCQVSVRDVNGNIVMMPVSNALALQSMGTGEIVYSSYPSSTVVTTYPAPVTTYAAPVVTRSVTVSPPLSVTRTVTVQSPVAISHTYSVTNGTVISASADTITFRLPNGTITSVPASSLSADFLANHMVLARAADGRLMRIPLGSALHLQSIGAAVIVSPTESIAVPPYP